MYGLLLKLIDISTGEMINVMRVRMDELMRAQETAYVAKPKS